MNLNSQTIYLCQRPVATRPHIQLPATLLGVFAVRWRFCFALLFLFISTGVGQSQQAVGGDQPKELQKAETTMHGAGADASQFPELVLQSGHSGSVNAIAFSHDQELLATVDFGGKVRLWNPQTGEVIRILPAYSDGGLCLAFSPDDKTLALGNFRGEVVLFETASGRLIRRYAGHRDRVWSVSFSPNGQKLASVADDGTIRLRHAESGRMLKTFTVASTKGQREKLFIAAQFAPRDDIVFAVDSEGLLYQFDAQTGKQQTQWPGAGRVLAISPDGELVASFAASDADEMSRHTRDKARSVTVWKTDSDQVRFTLPVNDHVLSLAFSTGGKTLLAALGNPHSGFWNEEEAIPPGHILAWSMESGSRMRHRLVPGGQVSQLATVPVRTQGQGAAQSTQPAHITNAHITNAHITNAHITNAHIPRTELFASISQGDGRVRLWNLHPELVGPSASNDVPILLSPERVLPTDWAKVKSMAVTPDGTALAVGDVSGVQFWNLSSLTLVKRVPDEIALERTVLCAPTGTFFGAAGSHEDGPVDSKVEPHVRLYTPDGEPLPAAGQDNPNKRVNEKRYATMGAFSISTDGQRIATSEDYHVRVYDIRTGRKLREWSAGNEHLARLHFLPPIRAQKAVDSNSATAGKINQEKTSAEKTTAEKAGRALGSRGRAQPAELIVGVAARTMSDTGLRVWDAATGEWQRRLVTGSKWPLWLASSSDGHWLASGNLDGTVQLWDMSSSDMVMFPKRTIAAHGPIRRAGSSQQETKDMTDGVSNPVRSVAFSPLGKWLATGSDDATVKIWQMPEGRLLRTLNGFDAGVTSVLFLPQTKGLLATGSADGILKLWDATNGKLVLNLYCPRPATDRSGHASMTPRTDSPHNVPTWLVWTPQGYYDGSPDAESLIRWRVPRESAHPDGKRESAGERERQWELRPASQYQSMFRRPDLIRALVARYRVVDGNSTHGVN